jgi:hypothetical protein
VNHHTVRRWVIVGSNGWMVHACQGRNTYTTREEAQAWIDAVMANNSPERVSAMFRLPLSVSVADCYPTHLDPVGCYWPAQRAKG